MLRDRSSHLVAIVALVFALDALAQDVNAMREPDTVPRTGGLPMCETDLDEVTQALEVCENDLMTCEGSQVAKRAFVTTETFFSGDLGGISGADAKCQGAADAAELGGTWKAWIAAGTASSTPAARFTPSPWGYERLDGRILGGTGLDAFPAALISTLDIDENGQKVRRNGRAWTGLTREGRPDFRNCRGWTSNSSNDQGILGITSSPTLWTMCCSSNCDGSGGTGEPGRLYCFEQ